MNTAQKVTRKEVFNTLQITSTDPTVLSFHQEYFTYRRPYYYHPKGTMQEIFADNLKKLTDAGYLIEDVSYGDHFAAFRGGDNIKKGSHLWAKFKVTKI